MTIPTVQEVHDFKTDIDAAEEFVNSDSATFDTRLGGTKDTITGILDKSAQGTITTYSAAATYDELTDWVEESGVVYRPIPSNLPIGPESFDSSKWIVAQNITENTFNTVTEAKAYSGYNSTPGNLLRTVDFSSSGRGGSATYLVKTTSQATSDGDTIDGFGNHSMSNGNVLIIQDVELYVEHFGALGDGSTDDTDAINAGMAFIKTSPDRKHISFVGGKTYIIDGGSNSAYSERGVNMTDGIITPSNCVVKFNGCTLKSSQGGATASNQFRVITNETKSQDATVTRSENITWMGPVTIEFTGTTDYYCNGVWINGGPLIEEYDDNEYFSRNIMLTDTFRFFNCRGGLVVRDENVFEDTAVVDSENKRMAGKITYDQLVGRNMTSFTASLDGDYIDGNLVSCVNDAETGFDCYSVIRGNNITCANVHATNCREYGCIIRSINNSSTTNISIGTLTVENGQGLLIADDSNQTLAEVTEEIHIGTVFLKNTGAVIEKRSAGGNTIIRDITIGSLHAIKGKSGGVLQSIGIRCEGVSTVHIGNVYIDNTDGECVVIRDSDNIQMDIMRAKRSDNTDDILQLIRSNDCSINMRRANGGNNVIFLEGDGTTGLDRNQINVGSATGYTNYIEIDQNSVEISSSTKIHTQNASDLSFTLTNPPAGTSQKWPTERDYVSLMPGLGLTQTLNAGEITVSYDTHRVDTQSGAATDDLDTINGGFRGQILTLGAHDNDRTIVIKHLTGNIRTISGSDISLTVRNMFYSFQFDGLNWVEIG